MINSVRVLHVDWLDSYIVLRLTRRSGFWNVCFVRSLPISPDSTFHSSAEFCVVVVSRHCVAAELVLFVQPGLPVWSTDGIAGARSETTIGLSHVGASD